MAAGPTVDTAVPLTHQEDSESGLDANEHIKRPPNMWIMWRSAHRNIVKQAITMLVMIIVILIAIGTFTVALVKK
ncbi:hypothetical protein GGR56DRAFT_674697 [Xylariaceae sp. FL0804]|nr:hypothetical protein GGR56DRAFT_674697 [Xylariaceae sp. FL0804]